MDNLTIIKKIAKQGKNLVLIIPKNLHPFLQRGDLVKVQIDKLQVEDAKKSEIFGTSSINSEEENE
jgi:antitoxin component of MazEF toxin-antitoxin module